MNKKGIAHLIMQWWFWLFVSVVVIVIFFGSQLGSLGELFGGAFTFSITDTDKPTYTPPEKDSCTDYNIANEFRTAFDDDSINAFKDGCETNSGIWNEDAREMGCYWNPTLGNVDCDSSSVNVLEWFCESQLLAKWNCDNSIAYAGCLCNRLPPDDWLEPEAPAPDYNPGDSVGGIDDNFNMGEGVNGVIVPIDLGDLPPTEEGGEFKLQALINTNWNYITPATCMGIQAGEGMFFELFDSSGSVWSRTDTSPIALGSATSCGLVWDGETEWKFEASKILQLFNCQINLEYDINVVICE